MKETYQNRAITSSSKRAASKKPESKIQFIKSPTGKFGLAYNAGDILNTESVDAKIIDKLTKEGYAISLDK